MESLASYKHDFIEIYLFGSFEPKLILSPNLKMTNDKEII